MGTKHCVRGGNGDDFVVPICSSLVSISQQELRIGGSQWNEQGNWGLNPQALCQCRTLLSCHIIHTFSRVFLFLPLVLWINNLKELVDGTEMKAGRVTASVWKLDQKTNWASWIVQLLIFLLYNFHTFHGSIFEIFAHFPAEIMDIGKEFQMHNNLKMIPGVLFREMRFFKWMIAHNEIKF